MDDFNNIEDPFASSSDLDSDQDEFFHASIPHTETSNWLNFYDLNQKKPTNTDLNGLFEITSPSFKPIQNQNVNKDTFYEQQPFCNRNTDFDFNPQSFPHFNPTPRSNEQNMLASSNNKSNIFKSSDNNYKTSSQSSIIIKRTPNNVSNMEKTLRPVNELRNLLNLKNYLYNYFIMFFSYMYSAYK